MSDNILFGLDMTFATASYRETTPNNEIIEFWGIAIRNHLGLIERFTGLEVCACKYTGRDIKAGIRSKAVLSYICAALNYICSHNAISAVEEITAPMIHSYFEYYCNTPTIEDSEYYRSKQSINKCVLHVSNFFANLKRLHPAMAFKIEEIMYADFVKKNKDSSRVHRAYVPIYKPKRHHSRERKLIRDLPSDIVDILIDLAYVYDPMLAFSFVASKCTGIRPGESMNLRQEGSDLGDAKCIRYKYIGSGISMATIDLNFEYALRDDGKRTAGIKKERTVYMYHGFVAEFIEAYEHHKKILNNHICKEPHLPMFLDSRGHAMTYETYRKRFQKLVKLHLVPYLLKSDNPEHLIIGQILQTRNISPHIWRHIFTVRLVKAGVHEALVMFYRGDSSLESVLPYLVNKQELEKGLSEVQDCVLDALIKGGSHAYFSD